MNNKGILTNTLLVIFLLVIDFNQLAAKGTPTETQNLSRLLEPYELFTYKVTSARNYTYSFNGSGKVEIQHSPTISLKCALPLFRSEKLVGNVGLNYYRT